VTRWSADAPDVLMTGLMYTSLVLPSGDFASTVSIDRRFFDVFGVRLLVGGFTDADYVLNPEIRPVLISHHLWEEHFDKDPNVLGRIVRPRGFLSQPYKIVGVLAPDGFLPPLPAGSQILERRDNRVDAVVPWMVEPDFGERGLVAFARVGEGQLAAADAALDRAAVAYGRDIPAPAGNLTPGQLRARAAYQSVELIPLDHYVTRRERPMFALVFGAVIGLVGIVFLNAGALAAARASQRVGELSLRRALGARTRDLLRHALAEQIVLTVPGATIGLALSPLLVGIADQLLPLGLTLIKETQVDWRVAAFAGLVTAATAMLVALFPVQVALRRRQVSAALAEAHGAASGRTIAGRLLIAGQVALAFVVILGGAFFTASLLRVWEQEPGFRTDDAAIVGVIADSPIPYSRGTEVASSLRGMPGVLEAAVFTGGILSYGPSSRFRPGPGAAPAPGIRDFEIGSGFFEATGVRLLRGRLPFESELDTGAPAIVVSESVERTYWPDRSAIDQTMVAARVEFRVIGVVEDVRWEAPDIEPTGAIYAPWVRIPGQAIGVQLLLTFDGDPDVALTSAITHLTQTNADLSVRSVQMVNHALDETMRGRRFSAVLASVFGVVALIFIAIGMLGLVAMTASRRTREVGIRMALGAKPGWVVRQLIGEQLGAVIAGILVGSLFATWAVRFVQAHLYETGVDDPAVWTTTIAVMVATATLGAWLPARRASRVDPVTALREN